jgi:hypothetical protein
MTFDSLQDFGKMGQLKATKINASSVPMVVLEGA